MGNTWWDHFWVPVAGFRPSVPSISNPSLTFPPTEYKMESNPGPSLLAAKLSLAHRLPHPSSLLSLSRPFHNLRGSDPSFYDHGQGPGQP